MAIQFNYFGYKYEIVDDDKKEVALIGAGNAPERCVVPKKVENNGSVYTVVEIKWSPFTDRDYYNKVNNTVKAVVLYPTIRIIGNNAFRNCSKLNEINIPDSVTEIGENAFYVCKSLTSITIPDSVTEIGYGAFYACNSLTSITIPDSVTKIGNGAFNDCSSLTSITIPTSVEKIGACAFFGSKNLKVEICNEEGDVLIHPEAFHPTAEIKYVGKKAKAASKSKLEPKPKVEAKPESKPEPKSEAKPEPKPKVEAKPEPKPEPKVVTPATDGNGLVLQKRTVVADLKAAFNARFGAKLRVYSGRSQAEESATLGELGLTNEGEFECRASLTVGSFIERMQSEHGLKVKVYTCDEWVAVLDGLTLERAGKVKKNAVKADMESMIAYQRTDDAVETAVVDIKKSATYGDYTINIASNNSVTVLKGGVACDNARGAMREVAALVGFEVDAAWTTQQLGSKLVNAINS